MRILSSLFLAVWLLSVPARADVLQSRFTVDELKDLLVSEGYGSPMIENGNRILFKSSGTKIAMVVLPDGNLQLYCGFKPVQIAPDKINLWNRSTRYSRLFSTDDGAISVAADFLMSKGASREQVAEFIKLFANYTVARFRLFVADNRADKNSPAPAKPEGTPPAPVPAPPAAPEFKPNSVQPEEKPSSRPGDRKPNRSVYM